MREILKIIYDANKERRLLSFDDVINICSIIIDLKKYFFC